MATDKIGINMVVLLWILLWLACGILLVTAILVAIRIYKHSSRKIGYSSLITCAWFVGSICLFPFVPLFYYLKHKPLIKRQ